MPDAFKISFRNEVSCLELEFTPGEGRTLDAILRVHQQALALSFAFSCFGYDLAEFARGMESLHARYDSEARFIDQAGDVELSFSMAL